MLKVMSWNQFRVRSLGVLLALAAGSAVALDAEQLMTALTWEKRVLLVFTPDRGHAAFERQLALLDAVGDGLRERDMSLIRVFADGRVDYDGSVHAAAAPGFFRRFAVAPGGFRVVLVGKDGGVKLDRDRVVTSDELFALIDAMPMRRYEMQLSD